MELQSIQILTIVNTGISLIIGLYMLALQKNNSKKETIYWAVGSLIVGTALLVRLFYPSGSFVSIVVSSFLVSLGLYLYLAAIWLLKEQRINKWILIGVPVFDITQSVIFFSFFQSYRVQVLIHLSLLIGYCFLAIYEMLTPGDTQKYLKNIFLLNAFSFFTFLLILVISAIVIFITPNYNPLQIINTKVIVHILSGFVMIALAFGFMSAVNMQLDRVVKEREERFSQMIKNSFDMIVLIDSNGNQHFVSESCEKILGYKPEELMGIPVIEQMIHPDDQERTLSGFKDIIAKSGVGGVQYRHRHKNGSWVYLEAFGSNQIENPSINSIVLNARDITERKNSEELLRDREANLRELNASKDKFFSIIAHDLRSPFNCITGLSNLLVEMIHEKDYKGIENYAKMIQDSSEHAMKLLMNLLEWSLSQTGKMNFTPETVDLAVLIAEAADLLNESAQQKSIRICRNLPESIPVFADKAMISTVLRNLMSNGIKFSHPGGKITISTEQKEDKLLISFTDNGVGMKKVVLDKLFHIEESCSTVGTISEKGTGLGLLLCKEFIEQHNGEIWVESEERQGSVFTFSLPLVSLYSLEPF